jgi:hypothetical protein
MVNRGGLRFTFWPDLVGVVLTDEDAIGVTDVLFGCILWDVKDRIEVRQAQGCSFDRRSN